VDGTVDPPNVNIIVSPEMISRAAAREFAALRYTKVAAARISALSLGRGMQTAIAYFDRLPRHTDILSK
jgi:hypothetical protein